jgi:hypothetical protein
MADHLEYHVSTSSGNRFDLSFPLHPDTMSKTQVARLLTAILGAVDTEINTAGGVGNGDVLQAVAMALAVRARILGVPSEQIDNLARELVNAALGASVTHTDSAAPEH